MSDPFWANNFRILLSPEKVADFFPSKTQTTEQRLNSIVRLSLYISVLLCLYHSKTKYISIFMFVLLLTYVVHTNKPETENAVENLTSTDSVQTLAKQQNAKCTKPTLDNPFMNATMKDYMNLDENGKIVDRPEACDPNDPGIKKMIDEKFNNNLYTDVSDVFGKMNSQRNYYTMPWTSIPNDPRGEFQKWLFLNPKTCKEDQESCSRNIYEDVRANRPVVYNPSENPVMSSKLM